MKECECLPICPFFNEKMKDMPTTTSVYKKRYCLGDNSKCARYMIFKALGKEKVPPDLFPNQIEIARKLLKENGIDI